MAQGLSSCCARPLLARYDLAGILARGDPFERAPRISSLWRYAELLPARDAPVSLGEGWTPLLAAPRLARELDLPRAAAAAEDPPATQANRAPRLWIKDEAQNPTGSFKARGLSVAVTMAKERGARRLAIPTAGNAGLAMAAYAAAAGLEADVFCPRDTPGLFVESTRLLGARVHLVDGFITDCTRLVRERAADEGWIDLSTLKEPYRLEGKKTIGFELFEQLGGALPEIIIYPTGGGTGLVGMWKAFEELQALGRIGPERPRMVSVQAEGCAPIVRAFHAGTETAEAWESPSTIAAGLRVPGAVGDRLILAALRESSGTAVTVSDAEMVEGARLLGRAEGIMAAPEGGATIAALAKLVHQGFVRTGETVVLFNTGTAWPYLDAMRS